MDGARGVDARGGGGGRAALGQPWFCGAPRTTLPPLEDHSIHRFDLMKRRMESPEGDAPLLARMGETLRAGHRVWVAGWINHAPPLGQPVRNLKPAPDPNAGWNEVAYLTIWAVQARDFLQAHELRAATVPVPFPGGQTVNESGWMQLFVVEGWRP